MIEEIETASSAHFNDPRNVEVGRARVIWAIECRPLGSASKIAAGWALPGGTRTTDRDEAVMVACALDALMTPGKR